MEQITDSTAENPVIQSTEIFSNGIYEIRVDLCWNKTLPLTPFGDDISKGINNHTVAGKFCAGIGPCTVTGK